MDAGLLKAAKQAIEVLLKLKGEDVVLATRDRVETASGGHTNSAGADRASQKFAIRVTSDGSPSTANQDRKVRSFPFRVVGRYNAVAEPGDSFTWASLYTVTIDTVDSSSGFHTVMTGTGLLAEVEP